MWTPGSVSLRVPNSIFRGLDAAFVRNTNLYPGSSRNTIRREPATTLQSLSDPPPASGLTTSTQVHQDSEPSQLFRHAELNIPVNRNKHHHTRHEEALALGQTRVSRQRARNLGCGALRLVCRPWLWSGSGDPSQLVSPASTVEFGCGAVCDERSATWRSRTRQQSFCVRGSTVLAKWWCSRDSRVLLSSLSHTFASTVVPRIKLT